MRELPIWFDVERLVGASGRRRYCKTAEKERYSDKVENRHFNPLSMMSLLSAAPDWTKKPPPWKYLVQIQGSVEPQGRAWRRSKLDRKMSCNWPCLQCCPARVQPEVELAGAPTLQQSEESMCVSVDAPEPYASQQWSRDKVRRLSVPMNSRTPSSVALGFSAKQPSRTSMTREKRHYIRTFFHVPDNKLSLKLFGSRRGVKEEQERQEQTAFYVIHPCSIFR